MYAAPALADVATGRDLVLYAILLNIVGMFLSVAAGGFVVMTVGLAAAVLAVVGVLRIGSGLGYSDTTKALLVIAAFMPFVDLLVFPLVCGEATLKLRAAGYKAGLTGARH